MLSKILNTKLIFFLLFIFCLIYYFIRINIEVIDILYLVIILFLTSWNVDVSLCNPFYRDFKI